MHTLRGVAQTYLIFILVLTNIKKGKIERNLSHIGFDDLSNTNKNIKLDLTNY